MGRVGNIVFGLIVTDFISTYKVDYKTEYRDWGGGEPAAQRLLCENIIIVRLIIRRRCFYGEEVTYDIVRKRVDTVVKLGEIKRSNIGQNRSQNK